MTIENMTIDDVKKAINWLSIGIPNECEIRIIRKIATSFGFLWLSRELLYKCQHTDTFWEEHDELLEKLLIYLICMDMLTEFKTLVEFGWVIVTHKTIDRVECINADLICEWLKKTYPKEFAMSDKGIEEAEHKARQIDYENTCSVNDWYYDIEDGVWRTDYE